jgi:hypothetical protein
MSNHEENGEVVEPEAEDTPEISHEDRFGQLFDEIGTKEEDNELPDDLPADPEPGDEAPETDEADAGKEAQAAAPAEGPGLAMKNLAKQQGVPQELIDTARDDEQLEQWMGMVAKRQDREPAEEVVEYSPELPEDEYPEDDPLRRSLVTERKYVESVKEEIYGHLQTILGYTLDHGDKLEGITKETIRGEQKGFQDQLDEFDNEFLGKYSELATNKDADALRGLIHQKYMDLKQELPDASDKSLIAKAAATFGQQSKSKSRNDVVRRQASQRLGGPESAKGAPEPKLSREQGFYQQMKEIKARQKA